jgi:hypothetical protein
MCSAASLRTLKELSRSYLTISKDLLRVMNRLKALYRSWGIPCDGTGVYAPRYRSTWLGKIAEAGVRRRAEFFYQQLDALQILRRQARQDLLVESRNYSATKLLRQIPCIGPIRAALLIALMQTLGYLSAALCAPAGTSRLGRSLGRAIARRTGADQTVRFTLSTSGREGSPRTAYVLSQQILPQQALVKTLGLERWHRSTPRG